MTQRESDELMIEPNNPSGGEVASKTIIGIIIGIIVAFAIFIIIILVGKIFKEAFQNKASNNNGIINPLLPLILILIAFITTMIGNIITVGIYNFFMPNKYYDLMKMFSLVFISNILLFFIILPLYILYFNDIMTLFFILAFHIVLSVYVSTSILEFFTNPNYSGVNMIGTTMGFSLTLLGVGIVYKLINQNQFDSYQTLLVMPSILAYSIIPLVTAVWQKIYYKLFYQAGNNFLYIPSLNEVMVESEDDDEVNVE